MTIRVPDASVAQLRAAGVARAGTLLEPVEALGVVDLDERGVLVGIIGTDPFDVLPVARGAGIGHHQVVVGPAFLAFPLKADASRHVAVVGCVPELGPQRWAFPGNSRRNDAYHPRLSGLDPAPTLGSIGTAH